MENNTKNPTAQEIEKLEGLDPRFVVDLLRKSAALVKVIEDQISSSAPFPVVVATEDVNNALIAIENAKFGDEYQEAEDSKSLCICGEPLPCEHMAPAGSGEDVGVDVDGPWREKLPSPAERINCRLRHLMDEISVLVPNTKAVNDETVKIYAAVREIVLDSEAVERFLACKANFSTR